MGMPFPAGLRALSKTRPAFAQNSGNDDSIEWAWAMNASASVLGSALAIVLAMRFGLSVTLGCGAVAYCLAIILIGTLEPDMA